MKKDPWKIPEGAEWFVQARFGMFIHWGLYALAARHEWVMHREHIPPEEYQRRYFRRFDPDLFDPEAWAETAHAAGMKYVVITSKHHEGFCLWDSRHTAYKATRTPAARDLLRPLLDAFRARGLRTGLYYSLIDWHHSQYVLDRYHGPYRDHPDREIMNQGRNQMHYADYLHRQVRELLTHYGPIDILWLDYSYPREDGSGKGRADWRAEDLVRMARRLQPGILLNDRLDLPQGGDFKTPEQAQPHAWPTMAGQRILWEACQTFSGSWGYHRDEDSWRAPAELLRTLVDCVGKGGNLLLNVGPTGRGEIDERALVRLQAIGRWMRRHGRSVYGCTQAPAEFKKPEHALLTYHPERRRLYVHLAAWPYRHVVLEGRAYREQVEYAQFLHDASEVPMNEPRGTHTKVLPMDEDHLLLTLPLKAPAQPLPVIELFLKPVKKAGS